MSDYITTSDMQGVITTSSNAEANVLVSVISGVSRLIDNYTGRNFETPSTQNNRYVLNTSGYAVIDDLQSVNGVWLNEDSTTDYILQPANSLPRERIYIKDGSAGANVHVNGSFGYATTGVPEDIKLAAMLLTKRMWETQMKGGTIQRETIGDYSFTLSTDLKGSLTFAEKVLLDKHKKGSA